MNDEKPLDYCDDKSIVPYGDNRGAPAFGSNEKSISKWKNNKQKSSKDYFQEKYNEIKQEYEKLKNRYDNNETVNKSEMGFQPIIGKEYYLYERENKTTFLSLISPQEWSRKDIVFKGRFKLDSHDVWKQMDS